MLEGRPKNVPFVLWLTGLSGSGKTTIAERVAAKVRARGLKVEELDGDRIREMFPNTGFSKQDRIAHVERVGFLAQVLQKNGVCVVASLISPYRSSREFVRNLCPGFVEVYLSTSLEECERRDVKGLYAKARRGEIRGFTGIDDPYEEPLSPELNLDTARLSVEDSVSAIMRVLKLD